MDDENGTDDTQPETADDDGDERCETCGTRLSSGSWHPTIGHTDADGAYRIVRFCSDACREEWHATHEEP